MKLGHLIAIPIWFVEPRVSWSCSSLINGEYFWSVCVYSSISVLTATKLFEICPKFQVQISSTNYMTLTMELKVIAHLQEGGQPTGNLYHIVSCPQDATGPPNQMRQTFLCQMCCQEKRLTLWQRSHLAKPKPGT